METYGNNLKYIGGINLYIINKKMLINYVEKLYKNQKYITIDLITIAKFEKYYIKINNLKNKNLIFIYE